MKKFAIIILITIMNNAMIAQDNYLNWVGINALISTGDLIRFGGELDGGVSFTGKTGFSFGIGYLRTISKKFDLELGIDISRNSFSSTFINSMGQPIINANLEHVDLISIPVNFKFKLKHGFFVTGGTQFDQRYHRSYSSNIDNQTGLGINFKIGKDFRHLNKMIFSIATELALHAVLPFDAERNQQRLAVFGLRLGYRFGL